MGCIQPYLLVVHERVCPLPPNARNILPLSFIYGLYFIFSDFICISTCSVTLMHAFLVLDLSEIFTRQGDNGMGRSWCRCVY
jgi:hypothetical protein